MVDLLAGQQALDALAAALGGVARPALRLAAVLHADSLEQAVEQGRLAAQR
jgi:hypothetical protein